MPIHNSDIVEILNRVADLLDIRGDNPFRIRAYRNAARTVGSLPQSAAALLAEGRDLSELPGIGKDLAGKVAEIVETGTLAMLAELEEETPEAVADLLTLPGLGPKKAAALHKKLGISCLEELAEAARAGRLRKLEGFGEKTEAKILKAIERHAGEAKRMKISTAEEIVESLLAYLKGARGVKEVVAAGSYRRRRETVGDLDILVTGDRGAEVMERFTGYDEVREVVSKGETRSTVILRSGLQVDVRFVPPQSYGAALHYFTGSREHNIAIRQLGVKKGLKVNEYGVFRGEEGEERVGGRTEEEVFAAVGLPFIVPELRENLGEIEAARKGKLPKPVTLEDIRGDLHAHTRATDGRSTLEEMARAARELGYDYLAISEHSKAVTVARGMDEKRLRAHLEAIDRLNETFRDFRLLKAIEVDILEDGSLDLPDSVLAELDFTVCSIHSRFDLPEKKQTARIIRAMDNRCFNILGHPSGRLIGERDPYEIDLEGIMEEARQRGCHFELNAHPDRLDLTDVHCRMAKEMGLKVAISTDAHFTSHLGYMRFGIGQARRGWLEKGDVLNTRKVGELLRLLKR
jgi:DNA polymerase (family 10)